MFTDARTDGHTDGRRIDRYTISSPGAFGSGELKKKNEREVDTSTGAFF